MRCPKCQNEMIRSRKDPSFMLCTTCKKKYRVPTEEERRKEERMKRRKEFEESGAEERIERKAKRIIRGWMYAFIGLVLLVVILILYSFIKGENPIVITEGTRVESKYEFTV